MIIENGCIVSIHYELRNTDGTVISASPEGTPLTYVHGSGSIISGLERELTGKRAGDEFRAVIQPEDGYGKINPNLITVFKREAFAGIDSIQPGAQLQAQDSQGGIQIITVKSVSDEEVTVDRNHPLAGQTLVFDIKVESVRK